MLGLLIIGIPVLLLVVIAQRGAAHALHDNRTDFVQRWDMTPEHAHALGLPYKKRRR